MKYNIQKQSINQSRPKGSPMKKKTSRMMLSIHQTLSSLLLRSAIKIIRILQVMCPLSGEIRSRILKPLNNTILIKHVKRIRKRSIRLANPYKTYKYTIQYCKRSITTANPSKRMLNHLLHIKMRTRKTMDFTLNLLKNQEHRNICKNPLGSHLKMIFSILRASHRRDSTNSNLMTSIEKNSSNIEYLYVKIYR